MNSRSAAHQLVTRPAGSAARSADDRIMTEVFINLGTCIYYSCIQYTQMHHTKFSRIVANPAEFRIRFQNHTEFPIPYMHLYCDHNRHARARGISDTGTAGIRCKLYVECMEDRHRCWTFYSPRMEAPSRRARVGCAALAAVAWCIRRGS